jgi:hypothetical protein
VRSRQALPFHRFSLLMNLSALFAAYNILACAVMPVFSRLYGTSFETRSRARKKAE